jgi:hypothetical protein
MVDQSLFIAALVTTVGFVIGLGAVTVIDIHGVLGKGSAYWRVAAVRTHKVTKPLIWLGSALVGLGYLLSSAQGVGLSVLWYIYAVLILNGCFLSFVVSPKLIVNEKAGKPEAELPASWQKLLIVSTIISFLGWWPSLFIYLHAVLAAAK